MTRNMYSKDPVVQLKGIVKQFPGVTANDRVDFDLFPNEVHSLVGENGAGKTTLMNILYGLHTQDEGQIFLRGEEVKFSSAHEAITHGLGMVHQHFQLVKTFTVAENIILGQPSSRGPLVEDMSLVYKRIEEISQKFDLNVNPRAEIWQLSVGEQQRVEILKTLYRGAQILILDEPTAFLTPQEADELLEIIHTLKTQGKSIVFISHKLDEVLRISDRITVLRDGIVSGKVDLRQEQVQKGDLARMMVGRDVLFDFEKGNSPPQDVCFEIKNLWVNDDRGIQAVKGVDLTVREGEILGIAGVAGNGQRELEEAIRGLRAVEAGTIDICGKVATHMSPKERIALQYAHVPSDRYGHAMLSDFNVAENLILENFFKAPFTKKFLFDFQKINDFSQQLVEKYDIRTPSVKVTAGKLSGGNAQKLVFARELSLHPRFLLVAQPTRGLDIRSAEFMHRILLQQREKRVAVLLISTELEEIFGLSDRIAVMYEGEIVDVVPADLINKEKVGLMMAGVKTD